MMHFFRDWEKIMPYIKSEDRDWLDQNIELISSYINSVGDLNYVVTRLSLRLLKKLGLNYNNISNIIGTLTLIPMEISRRIIGKYEDKKIKENGDVLEYKKEFFRTSSIK